MIAVGFYLSHEIWPGSENLSLNRKKDFISLIGVFAVCVYLRLARFFFSLAAMFVESDRHNILA